MTIGGRPSLAALIVAVIAVVVATAGFIWTVVWSVWQHRQVTRGRLYVRAAFAFTINPLGTREVFAVTVTNAGMVPVTITSVSAEVKGAEKHLAIVHWLLQTPRPLPHKLGPGETWDGHMEPDDLRRGAAEITGRRSPWKITIAVKDAADRRHRAPLVKFQ